MKILLFSLIIYPLFAQTDTMYFDATSGNYVIKYLGTTEVGPNTGQDTFVTLIYEPPTKIDPVIEGFVSIATDGKYLYRYKITNGAKAKQNLNEFSLHFGQGISVESKTPMTSWYNVRPKNYLPDTGSANRWVWRGHQGLEATWYIDSCMILTDGLPCITDSYSQAKTRVWAWPAGGPNQKDTMASDIRVQFLRLGAYPNEYVFRKTIGPKLPPNRFVVLDFLDTLISYTRQSVTLGWLESTRDDDPDDDERPDDGLSKNIEKRIEKARKELVQGDSAKARTELEKLVKKVEKIYKKSEGFEKKKHESEIVVTSEAYALLKYNAEYLIDRLPKQKGGKDHDEKDHH